MLQTYSMRRSNGNDEPQDFISEAYYDITMTIADQEWMSLNDRSIFSISLPYFSLRSSPRVHTHS